MDVPFLNLDETYTELSKSIDQKIQVFLSSGNYIGGDELDKFEKDWANYCGSKYAVGTGNGLDALTLALKAIGLKENDEVIVPANTFIATWLSISHCNAKIVPVDPDPETHNIKLEGIKSKVSPKTRVIIAVHLYGRPAPIEEIVEYAYEKNIVVVEDAAQAHGAVYQGKKIGCHGDIVAWSFYPGKNLGAFGDAGCITTNSEVYASRIRCLGNYGSSERYTNIKIGFNSRLDPFHAIVLSEKLLRLDNWNKRRIENASFYNETLKGLPLQLPKPDNNNNQSVFHQYVISTQKRDALQKYLHEQGVITLIHYPIPPFKQLAYQHLGFDEKQFPIASKLAEEILSLPIHPHLKTGQREFVVSKIIEFFKS